MGEKSEKDTSLIEYRLDEFLNEIVDKFNLTYLSDMHLLGNTERILKYLDEQKIKDKDRELYDGIIEYLNG